MHAAPLALQQLSSVKTGLILNHNVDSYPLVAEVITRGGIIAFRTDTFYGEWSPRTKAWVDIACYVLFFLPAMVVYETLNHVLDARGVRQDHIVMSRTTDQATGAATAAATAIP